MLFLSYSRENRETAIELVAELDCSGFSVFRDPPALTANPFWRDQVAERLGAAEGLIVLWSEQARASPSVDQEIRAYHGPVLVILMDGSTQRTYPFAHKRCVFSDKTDTIRSLRSLIKARCSRRQDGDRWSSSVTEDKTFSDARRERINNTRSDLAVLLRRLKRRPKLSHGLNGSYATNERDGSILRRLSAGHDCVTYIGVSPITNAQYEMFLQACDLVAPPTWQRSAFRIPHQPVVGISWFEAYLYAAWAGGQLLTEDEWMRAARFDNPSAEFATVTGQMGPQLAHFDCCLGQGKPVEATRFAATPGGYFGMAGNTWDWCVSDSGYYKVIKGGSYCDSARFCRIETRYRYDPLDRDCAVGLRVKVTDQN
jgi:sulfatase-modifying factor enzyme 1/TIR domain-containing protein